MIRLLATHRALALVLAVMAPLYAVWCWSGQSAHLGSDPFDYMMMAHHYAPYAPADPVFARLASESRFPPLYPLILAAFGGGTDWYIAHEVTLACLLLGLLALYAWMREERLGAPVAAAVALWSLLVPETWIAGLSIQSEYPYLLFTALAFWLLARHRRTAAFSDLALAALAVAAAVLTRTIGIALFAALAPTLWRERGRRAIAAMTVALVPLLLWHLLHRPTQAYQGALFLIYGEHPLSALRWQLARETAALRAGWIDDFLRLPPLRHVCEVVGVVLLLAAVRRAFLFTADGLYVLAYLVIVLLWPYPDEARRFLWPLIPVTLAQLMLSLRPSENAGDRRQWLAAGALAAFLLMTLPTLFYFSQRYFAPTRSGVAHPERFVSWFGTDPVSAENRVLSQIGMSEAMRAVAGHVPEGDCVLSVQSVDLTYFSGRPGHDLPLNSVPSPEFERRLAASGCEYVFIMSAGNDNYKPMFPWERIKGRVHVLDLHVTPGVEERDPKTVTILARLRSPA